MIKCNDKGRYGDRKANGSKLETNELNRAFEFKGGRVCFFVIFVAFWTRARLRLIEGRCRASECADFD